jgi:hypothetical protein
MATYNSALYAQETGQVSTAVGLATPIPNFADGKRTGGARREILVSFDTSLQNLSIADIVNVAVLPAGATPVGVTVITDTALSSATIELGVTGTATYFSTSAVSIASAGKTDVFTKLSNFGQDITTPTTVIATIAGAAWSTGKLYFLIEYLLN